MTKRAANVARGRVAKAAGDSFEAWIDVQHEGAKKLGVLKYVSHNQPQAKYLNGRLTYVAKSDCDYTGTMSDGKSFCAEGKSTKEAKKTKKLRLMRSAVKKKQAEQLDMVSDVSGVAYLLVEFRDGEGRKWRYAIPWAEVPWKTLKTAQSIGLEDLNPRWRVAPGECYLKRGVPMPPSTGGRKRVFARE